MSCSHTKYVGGYWRDNPNFEEGWSHESDRREYVEGFDKPTLEDLDLHRYHCTQCGEIFYYSQRAREAYESGDLTKLPGYGIFDVTGKR